MTELGALIAAALKGTTQAPDKKDPSKNSKAKYNIDGGVKADVLKRAKALLDKFPVYPQLDLEMLRKAFVE